MTPKSQKSKKKKYPAEFRQKALARLKTAENVSALARELGIRRKFLYQWRDEAEAKKEAVRRKSAGLQGQVVELERVVARQALELDFFKGALQRIEERRRKREETSEPASTSKSSQ